MESDDIRPREMKAHDIVDAEHLPGLKQKRLASHRGPVECFTLLVAQCLFDDLDAELRPAVLDLVVRIFEVAKKAVDSLPELRAGGFPAAPD